MKVNKKKGKKPKEKPQPVLTRKELRKQKLQQKKENKRLFFSNKAQIKQEIVNQATTKKQNIKKKVPVESDHDDDDESIASDFSDVEVDAKMPAKSNKKPKIDDVVVVKQGADLGVRKSKMAKRPDIRELHERELQQEKKLAKEAKRHRVKLMRAENEEEDRIIHSLEKKLKLNRTKDKNRLVRKMFSADGLDWALEFCLDDDAERKQQESKKQRRQEAEQQKLKADNWDEDDEDEENEDEDEHDDDDDDGDDDEDMPSDDEEMGSNDKVAHAQKSKDNEDIYGRKRDEHGNIITATTTKYIPPHQRHKMSGDTATDEKEKVIMERLRKSCKGLLNRLSEANLHKIASSIEELYMQHARYYMNDTLSALLNEALITPTLCNERMLQEHMVLLAYLHAHIGTEIGAHFLQYYMQQFDNYVKDLSQLAIEDKRLNNVVLVLCYIYMFRIYDHRLLLQIIEHLMGNLCEKAIECLLLVFQSVGFKLRKDDPLAFKQMLINVQQRVSKAPLELQDNLRLKFMTDVLHALKNNNLHKLPQVDAELPEQLRKRLKGMLRNDKYVTTLNIAMEDLLRADQVGKWWIVGSAWTGNINEAQSQANVEDGGSKKPSLKYSDKLLALARAQHMNTEERRQIFCIIMSAEDYVDAFEKILHLSLKDQRSIAYVVLHCCMQERQSNPYYAHLAHKFCQYNRKFQLAFQFASWDRIHDIEALKKVQIRNFAQLLLQLIARGSLSLSVLKVVDFVQLNKANFLLMKEIMLGLILWVNGEHDVHETQIMEAFERVAKNPKLKLFKNSIRLFLQYFLLKRSEGEAFLDARLGAVDLKLSDEQQELLMERGDKIDNILAFIDF